MVDWKRDTPWRQGSLLGADAMAALGLSHPDASVRVVAIVATHDCDLAQHPDNEPHIEVVVGRIADKDGNCTHAKNARRLHVELAGDVAFWCEFDATGKVAVAKQDLSVFVPRKDARLTPENHAVLQMWLASRYRRSAFADEFERRLTKETKLAEKIAKAIKPHGELIAGVFFDVDDGDDIARMGPDDTYKLDITILHAADPDFVAAENAANQAAAAIEKAFKDRLIDTEKKTWQHIELRFCEAISESVLTYQEFKRLKRWRLEHISLAADPQQPVLAE